jgi:uncharacterized protein
VLADSEDSEWRNQTEFLNGAMRSALFCAAKWAKELDYRLKKTLWGFRENRIAVSLEYEWRDASGQWLRSYGNGLWEFDQEGLMRRRIASINDTPIDARPNAGSIDEDRSCSYKSWALSSEVLGR